MMHPTTHFVEVAYCSDGYAEDTLADKLARPPASLRGIDMQLGAAIANRISGGLGNIANTLRPAVSFGGLRTPMVWETVS
jgi:hypothetical protein